jgi:curli biogenesis system outer membrane secretion channel CsgG
MRSMNRWTMAVVACLSVALVFASTPANAGLLKKLRGPSQEEQLDKPADGVSGEEKPAAAGVYEGPKKIIAATKFKSTSGINWDNGEAMGAMLSEALMATGKFIVVERAEVDDLIKEQDMGAEGRVTQATAAQFGQMLGASILVMGAVTQFEDGAASGNAGVGVPVPGLGSMRVGGGKTTAYVKVNLRMVDTTTGKILSTHNADGTASGKAKSGGLAIKGFDIHGGNAKQTPIGQACQDAIDQAVVHISQVMKGVPFYARVAEVDGGDIYINAGSNRNMKEGMVLNGYKVVKEIKDPDTGLVIDVKEEKTGSVKITSVKEKISIAQKVDGAITKGQTLKMD